jgi:hypothetical protein
MDIDFNKIRAYFHIPPDYYREYHVDPKNPEDVKMLEDMQETIRATSKTCFKKCINVKDLEFSKKEESCISNCVLNGVAGLEHLMRVADQQNKSKND